MVGAEKSDVFRRWFPLGVSLDLVRGSCREVAEAAGTEIQRFVKPDKLLTEDLQLPGFQELFESVKFYTNTPTIFYILSSSSPWTVLWNNTYLCSGYDSLCSCITRHHGLSTIHWSSSDVDQVFQAGTKFVYREGIGEDIRERSVCCIREDSRWIFEEAGEPLPDEDLESYKSQPKKGRLNEVKLMEFLDRLGARPWDEAWYDFAQPIRRLTRLKFPRAINRVGFEYIQKRCGLS